MTGTSVTTGHASALWPSSRAELRSPLRALAAEHAAALQRQCDMAPARATEPAARPPALQRAPARRGRAAARELVEGQQRRGQVERRLHEVDVVVLAGRDVKVLTGAVLHVGAHLLARARARHLVSSCRVTHPALPYLILNLPYFTPVLFFVSEPTCSPAQRTRCQVTAQRSSGSPALHLAPSTAGALR